MRLSTAVCLLALLLSAAVPARAQWTSTGGPPGGRFYSLGAPEGALLGASPWASLRYDGAAWNSLPFPLYGVDAQGTRVVARAADSLVLSTDAGRTYARISGTESNWQPLGLDGDALLLFGDDSLRVTRDDGAHWVAVQDDIWVHTVFGGGSQQSFPVTLNGFVGALTDGDAVLAAATAYVFGGVYRHAPGDTAWTALFQPGDGTLQSGVRPASLVRYSGGLWFGHSGGVHRSTDGGATWVSVGAGLPSSPSGVNLMTGGFGLVADAQGAFFRWTGSGWTPIPAPPTQALAVATGDRFYAAALGHTYSYDGAAWTMLPDVVASSPVPVAVDAAAGGAGALLVLSQSQLLRSADGGTTWATALSSVTGPFAQRPGEMLAGTFTALQRTRDGGSTWTAINRPALPSTAPSQQPRSLVVHDGAYYALYGYTRSAKHGILLEEYSGAFRSTDAGATWTPVFSGLPMGTIGRSPITAGAAFTGALFAVTGAGCIALPDGATAWVARACPQTGGLYEAAEAEGRWFVRGYSGLAMSTDGGQSWGASTAGLPVPTTPQGALAFWSTARLARTSSGLLLAADAGSGFHFYRYSGGTWAQTAATFPDGVSWVGFIEAADHTLYGGSNGRGLWRTTVDVVTGTTAPAPVAALALDAPTPNPAHNAVRVGFALPAAGPATLAVYDALGRRVAVLTEGELGAGTYELTWDAAGAAAGVYVVRLTTEDEQLVRRVTIVQ